MATGRDNCEHTRRVIEGEVRERLDALNLKVDWLKKQVHLAEMEKVAQHCPEVERKTEAGILMTAAQTECAVSRRAHVKSRIQQFKSRKFH